MAERGCEAGDARAKGPPDPRTGTTSFECQFGAAPDRSLSTMVAEPGPGGRFVADPPRPAGQRRFVTGRRPLGLVRGPETEHLGALRSFLQRAAASAGLCACSR